ncbi:PREDICTED: P2X purinoceptor 3 [Calidris pugnax]|uniref:P2X purinoceptor 3 n=1 Tax=Calidris pugnax TaxID=198806 RepID=UPI00071DBAAB|nr:PREDICTED: P2X purinoceptor 3 [Calidris pugnax]
MGGCGVLGGAPCCRTPPSQRCRPQGTVLCDIILLNFLKGAEHYKARKFEEVPEAGVPVPPASPTECPPGALGGCSRDKQSTDSGTCSLGL